MDKALIIQAIIDVLREDFASQQNSSRQIRSAGNDGETKAEGKYDTRSTEENYLADGLARQAHATAQAVSSYESFHAPPFETDAEIDLGALVELKFPDGKEWFFLGPVNGGIEVTVTTRTITVITPESPLGTQLIGRKAGESTTAPKAKILSVE
jgi:transcription elongation GreA/GreB family factor